MNVPMPWPYYIVIHYKYSTKIISHFYMLIKCGATTCLVDTGMWYMSTGIALFFNQTESWLHSITYSYAKYRSLQTYLFCQIKCIKELIGVTLIKSHQQISQRLFIGGRWLKVHFAFTFLSLVHHLPPPPHSDNKYRQISRLCMFCLATYITKPHAPKKWYTVSFSCWWPWLFYQFAAYFTLLSDWILCL